MWEERAHRARRDIAELAASGLGVADAHAAAIGIVERAVPSDLTCWATIDPQTLVVGSMTSGRQRLDPLYEPLLAEAEYAADEPHQFAALAQRRQPTAQSSELSEEDRRRSRRMNGVWRPLGLDHELRLMFLVGGACWGAAGLVRSGRQFGGREVEFLAAIGPSLASLTRSAVRSEVRNPHRSAGSAIVVLSAGGRPTAMTAGARYWQDRFDEIAPRRFSVMMAIMVTGARGSDPRPFRARVRDGRGSWVVLEAEALIGSDDGAVAVSVEPAAGDEMVALLMAAYGLSAREQAVCREVLAGRSTTEAADRLFISANTVQDHLKSVFAKVGVRSRGGLGAVLRG